MPKKLNTLLALMLIISGCKTDQSAEFKALADKFADWYLSSYPVTATWIGVHDYDSLMDDVSRGADSARVLYLNDFKLLLGTIEPGQLPLQQRIDYFILTDAIDEILFDITELKSGEWNPLGYVNGVGSGVDQLLNRDFAPLEERLSSLTGRLSNIPAYLDGAKERLSRAPRIHTETAIKQNSGNVTLLETGIYSYLAGAPDSLVEQVREAVIPALKAVREFGDWLERDLLPRSDMSFRLGKDLFDRKFRYRLDTDLTTDEVLKRAEDDLVKVQDRMYRVALPLYRNMTRRPGALATTREEQMEMTRAVLNDLARDHPRRENVTDNARRFLNNLTQFVRDRDILTLDESEPLIVKDMPEYMRGVAIAYLSSPGPLETKLNTFYLVSPIPEDWTDEQSESFLREYNNLSAQILSIHEAVPGHYVQLYYSNRFESVIRSIFSSGTFIEGWAHYCEQMMVDEGYGAGDPRMRLVQLKWRLRVIANTIIDQKIHKGDMDEEQVMEFLTEQAFQEESEAHGKWVRAQLTSTQLSTYYVGTMELLNIRSEYMKIKGEDYSLREFHEKLLSAGSPPLKYARLYLLPGGEDI